MLLFPLLLTNSGIRSWFYIYITINKNNNSQLHIFCIIAMILILFYQWILVDGSRQRDRESHDHEFVCWPRFVWEKTRCGSTGAVLSIGKVDDTARASLGMFDSTMLKQPLCVDGMRKLKCQQCALCGKVGGWVMDTMMQKV